MKTIVLTIASRDYALKIDDDEFAKFLKEDIKNYLGDEGEFSIKDLIMAFLKKSNECYLQNKGIVEILNKIDFDEIPKE